MNDAAFMREKDILSEVDALTPASRIYFALQCLYIFPARREHYGAILAELMAEYLAVAWSALETIIERIQQQVGQGEFYHALKTVRALIAHEKERLDNVSSPRTKAYPSQPPLGNPVQTLGLGADTSG